MGQASASTLGMCCRPETQDACHSRCPMVIPASSSKGGRPNARKTSVIGGSANDESMLTKMSTLASGKGWDAVLKSGVFAPKKNANADADEDDDEDGEGGGFKNKLQKTVNKAKKIQDDLQHGAMRGDVKKIKKALEAGANVSAANARGVTPLMHCAASSGKAALEAIKHLIDQKASVKATDANGWNALLHACRNGKTEAAKYLMSMGSDPCTTTSDQKTSLILATTEGKTDLVKFLLGNKAVRNLVQEKDALGWTALHYAVKDGSSEIVKLLIEQQAKVNAKDIDGRQPLMVACEAGKLETAKLLCKKGVEVDARDKQNRTALMYACLNTYEEVATWLLKKQNADPHIKDVSQESPLSIAEDMGMIAFKNMIKGRREAEDGD
eukprot:gnl/MRDRNA2_/MRDRNA2_95757_c0_seq1.p1 gnl/MRDRNA2_/MRDRNA2_95757_c0~~gnl/MRDRNA2_/MRDRNA2_95757_c0_seq1.p1  ORF type:complete len:383 (-),score=122.56 gnl/MRDRNA2_/MRDRNA2_95757_c0_seq1:165-1313(-)